MVLRLSEAEYQQLKARRRGERLKRLIARNRWEEDFALQLKAAGLTRFYREYRFLHERRFRFDFAFPEAQLAVELDGAVHRIKNRFASDREKHQLALVAGWRVLRVSNAEVRSGHALALVQRLLAVGCDPIATGS